MDQKLFQEFLEFKAFKLAAEAKSAQGGQSREPDSVWSHTTNQTSDPVDPAGMDMEADQAHSRRPLIPRSSGSIEPVSELASMSPQPLPSPKIEKNKLKYHSHPESPSQCDVNHDPTFESLSRSPTPGPPSTRYNLRERGQQAKSADSFNLLVRSPTLSSPRRHRSPSPQAEPSKYHHRSLSPDDSKPPPPHPYDTCPTSYKKNNGKRGARFRTLVNGKKEIDRTPMERLIHRKAKYKHVRKHGHLFGDKHGCYFNPYSYSPVNEENFKRIEKPVGVQVCRGGPNSKPLHELIGLRDDYDYRFDIGEMAREAIIRFLPDNLVLEPGEQLSYNKHYGSSVRIQINDYMYKRFPFLFHFRDESGDSWVIDAICTTYLYSNKAYVRAGYLSADVYLKRNESDSKGKGKDGGKDKVENEEIPSGYEDDYALNARAQRGTALRTLTTTNKRSRPSESRKEALHGYDDDSRSKKKQRGELEGRSLNPGAIPYTPTAADSRGTDKFFGEEQIRNNAPGNSVKVGAPLALKGGNEKRENTPTGATSKGDDVEMENDDSEEKPIRHTTRASSSPELKPILAPGGTTPKAIRTSTPNSTAKKNKHMDPPPVEGSESQPTPSTLLGWLSSITFGVLRW